MMINDAYSYGMHVFTFVSLHFHFISTPTDWDHTNLAKLSVIGLSMVTGAWLILTKHYRHWICKLGQSLG